jgi:hypothetical protein
MRIHEVEPRDRAGIAHFPDEIEPTEAVMGEDRRRAETGDEERYAQIRAHHSLSGMRDG